MKKSRSHKSNSDRDELDVPLHNHHERAIRSSSLGSTTMPLAAPSPVFVARSVGGSGSGLQPRNRVRSRSNVDLSNHQYHGSSGSLLPTVGENHQAAASSMAILLPPPSPGTPPKKSWETKLRNRLRGLGGGGGMMQSQSQPQPSSTTTATSGLTKNGIPIVKSVDSMERSVRGGKFFGNVFRSEKSSSSASSSLDRQRRQQQHSKSTDELDGTKRRGAEKAYSPGNIRFASTSLQDYAAMDRRRHSSSSTGSGQPPAPPLFIPPQSKITMTTKSDSSNPPHHGLHHELETAKQQEQQRSSAASSSAIKKEFTNLHNTSGDATSAFLGDEPSVYNSNLFAPRHHAVPIVSSKSYERFPMVDTTAISDQMNLIRPSSFEPNSILSSTRTATTIPTTQPKEESSSSVSSVPTLQPFHATDTWEQGRRYLIAPAVLASCPDGVASSFLGSTALPASAVNNNSSVESNNASEDDTSYLFHTIVLGPCLLRHVTGGVAQRQQWSAATLVLRQNYLLEYDLDENEQAKAKQRPRGYCHLQHATCERHEFQADALVLKYYASPCAKANERILLIRMIPTTTTAPAAVATQSLSLSPASCTTTLLLQPPETLRPPSSGGDASCAETSSKERNAENLMSSLSRNETKKTLLHWKECLNRAAGLVKLSDLYEVSEENLGLGQYGTVRSARRKNSGSRSGSNGSNDSGTITTSKDTQYCALKIFDKSRFWRMVVKGRERNDTIVREVSVQATLMSRCSAVPSFLRMRGYFETCECVVLELELLQGTDLFQYISSMGILEEPEAATILRDVLQCLDAMNRAGLAHRDIKPANILMCNGASGTARSKPRVPRVKVGDFGMSAFVGTDGQIRGRCGTPGFVAPEIFSAGVYGGYGNKVDVFSAGVTLYVMLCGYEPFYGETDEELKKSNRSADIDFPDEEWSKVSTHAKDLVKRMMHPNPAQRLDARQALQHAWFEQNLNEQTAIAPSSDSEFLLASPMNATREDADACIVC